MSRLSDRLAAEIPGQVGDADDTYDFVLWLDEPDEKGLKPSDYHGMTSGDFAVLAAQQEG